MRTRALLPLAVVLATLGAPQAMPDAHAGKVWDSVFHGGKPPRQRQQARQVERNRVRGAQRERSVERGLAVNPFTHYWKQVYLSDRRGNHLVDPVTGERRRFDFVVRGAMGGYKLVEVTGRKTNKSAQEAKTFRIVDGRRKIYVVLDGEVVNLGRNPRIERRDRR